MSDIQELYGELSPQEKSRWMVIYTKPRQEKKLAQYAQRNKIVYYLPLKESVRTYPSRKVTFYKPLFSGYVFVCCDFDQKRTLISSGHTVNFLRVDNEDELLEDLRQIYFGAERGAEFEEHEYIETGARVKIIKGAFAGLYGIVEDSEKKGEVVLQIHILKRAVSIKVKSRELEFLK